jgi:hypothetical protein
MQDRKSSSRNGNRCQQIKSDGQQCGANAMTNSNRCFVHHPDMAKKRDAARRAGGVERSRRAAVLPADTPDRPLRNKREVAVLLRDMINKVLRGNSI